MTYTNVINLIVAPVVLTLIYVYALAKIIRNEKAASRRSIQGLIMTGFYVAAMVIILTVPLLDAKDILQLVLTVGLVVATVSYAVSANKQAEASVRMAEEMREQRRPIVIPEVVPSEVETPKIHSTDYTRDDIFKIRNVGNGPATELQIVQLDKDKSHPQIQKKAILSQTDTPLEFYPVDLVNQVKTTCYLVCQYRSVLSTEERQIWYETWLPFIPNKSQRGDRIIITPRELKFCEGFEKKDY